ncbi:MAG: folylpolyglutamate synthase/dihydrofolate synthase family protein [Clostridia bacterium]
MNLEQALAFIHSTRKLGSKLGLDNIRTLTGLLGKPQDHLRFIHVAGTNGKGSTCAFLSHIMKEAGHKTGLFTSPDLEKYSERFQIDNENISDADLVVAVEKIRRAVETMLGAGGNHPTEFEINTALALLYFKEKKCDYVVWETGLGGRLDSTNVIDRSCLSIITAIDYDHTHILGDTIGKIAAEKAGIIKKGCPVLLYGDNPEEAVEVVRNKALEMQSLFRISDFSRIKSCRVTLDGQVFHYGDYRDIRITMLGDHQLKNAALSVDAALMLRDSGIPITVENIYAGLENARWPGRFEILHRSPVVVCDGAHNVQGVRILRDTLEKVFPRKNTIFLMGVMKDKNYEEMARTILPGAKAAVSVRIDYERMLDTKTLAGVMQKYCTRVFEGDTMAEGMDIALELAGPDDLICSFGSLYSIAEVKKYVRERLHEL